MEGGLFNSGVLGADFLWWIGQIADDSTWRDNMMTGKFKNKDTIPGWGARYKVRIMGIHDQGQDVVPEADLPWANILYPVTAGGGQMNSWMSSNLRQGNMVFGFWMDGKDMQVPIIMGVLGNNAQTALGTKIGKNDNAVTNTQPGSLAKSGFAKGAVEKEGTKKEFAADSALTTEKPVSKEVAEESASPAPGTRKNQYGLPASRPLTSSQHNDISNAKSQAEEQGLSGDAAQTFVKNKVKEGINNRAGAAQSPNADPKPGPTLEHPDNPHQLSAGDVKLEDKLNEKIVVMNPDSPVESATKAIQTEVDNLTAKADKFLGARKNYIDAVSGPPTQEDMDKEIRKTAQKVAKYQKIIMDKAGEYDSKKMNFELAPAVANLPSSMRANFADQKFLNTENKIKEYNDITNKLVDQFEGILKAKLNLPQLTQLADALASSGMLFADSASQAATMALDLGGGGGGSSSVDRPTLGVTNRGDGQTALGDPVFPVGIGTLYTPGQVTTPKVPICYAEDLVAQVFAANQDALSGISSSQHRNYNRYLKDVQSQLEEVDKRLAEKAWDKSQVGKVFGITDEEEDDLPQGGTNYYSENGAPCSGGSGSGFKVDIIVPDGGLYDNDFITINQEGAGYTVNTADGGGASGTGSTTGTTTTGGSGSGIKVNYTISGGKITGITTNTAGENYKNGDVLTVVNNASGTPSTNCTFTVVKVRGTVNTVKSGGIKIAEPGSGYKMGELLTVSQSGSGQNCGVVITQVVDPGEKKATAGPVTPGDTSGSVADAQPGIGQKLGDMLQMLGGMQGNLSQAMNFENLKGNLFPFETPPNVAVSDYYTMARGGAAQAETEVPNTQAIQKAVSKVKDIAPPIPDLPFAGPTPNMPSIDLAMSKAQGFVDSLGIDKGVSIDDAKAAFKKAKSKLDSGIA